MKTTTETPPKGSLFILHAKTPESTPFLNSTLRSVLLYKKTSINGHGHAGNVRALPKRSAEFYGYGIVSP